jgi:hypothetical protein
MKKIFTAICILLFSCTHIAGVSFALTEKIPNAFTPIVYPEGEDFSRLESIIWSSFTLEREKSYVGSCINWGWLCPNYKYSSLSEKALKYIVLKTYAWHEDFYAKLFDKQASYYNYFGNDADTSKDSIQVLNNIPKGAPVLSNSINLTATLWLNNSMPGDLIDASFGLDFREGANSDSMLSALDQKIKDMKRSKCQQENIADSYKACPYSGEISNRYLPTLEQLYKETIYLNRGQVKIETIKNEFEYTISWWTIPTIPEYPRKDSVDQLLSTYVESIKANTGITDEVYREYMITTASLFLANLRKSEENNQSLQDALVNDQYVTMENYMSNVNNQITIIWQDSVDIFGRYINGLLKEKEYYLSFLRKESPSTYTIRYKKTTFTLGEAKAELDKKIKPTSAVFGSNSWWWNLPCMDGWYMARSKCAAAMANMNTIMTALGAYYSDREVYPDTIDKLDQNYLPRGLWDFKKNFSYTLLTGATTSSDYEIRYIGDIDTDTKDPTSGKKDYSTLLSGATLPDIPGIFGHIPKDSMVLYIKNPENLFALLSEKTNTSTRISWVDISESVKEALKQFLEVKDFSLIEKNLKHETAFVIDNLDLTSPDITMIVSESDRDALAPSAVARVVGSKDGFIFIAKSKSTIDRLMNLDRKDSLSEAPDFHYVWWKKASIIRDAFFFVGDAFFEKMLTFETYITHYRKYRDVKKLWALQELVWSYEDAFWKTPESLFAVIEGIPNTKIKKEDLSAYTLTDGIVSENHLGNMKNIKTLSENNYDLSEITRGELEDYKSNILKYKENWRANLDPMWVVFNRYGDGMEIDFFMTPIPDLTGTSFAWVKDFFQWTTKDNLSFLTNPHIRMGLLSFVVGFDPKKLEKKMQSSEDLWKTFTEWNKSMLDGKNIFDYLGGESAFSLGNLPSDIFEWWNIEKIDAYISIQVASEEKWKEFIDILRKKMTDKMGSTSWGLADAASFLAKPLIEDYGDKKIYYVDAIPAPLVGKIGFAYTFVDDFFFLAPNRTTIRHIIDTSTSWDINKWTLTDSATSSTGSFFLTLFDGVSASKDLKWLYEKNKSSLPRYLTSMRSGYGMISISPLLSSYYTTSVRDRKFGKEISTFSYELGWLSLKGNDGIIRISIDEKKQGTLTGSALTSWNDITTGSGFPREILTEKGIWVEEFLALERSADIFGIELVSHLDTVFASTGSLFRNTTFSMNMSEDEIGFVTRVFRQKQTLTPTETPGSSALSPENLKTKNILFIILWAIVTLLLVSGGIYIFLRKKKAWSGSFSRVMTVASVTPFTEKIDDSAQILISPSEEITPPVTSEIKSENILNPIPTVNTISDPSPVITTIPNSPPIIPNAITLLSWAPSSTDTIITQNPSQPAPPINTNPPTL